MAGYITRWYPRPKTVTHPSLNRARRALTSFERRNPLTTTPRRHYANVSLTGCTTDSSSSSSSGASTRRRAGTDRTQQDEDGNWRVRMRRYNHSMTSLGDGQVRPRTKHVSAQSTHHRLETLGCGVSGRFTSDIQPWICLCSTSATSKSCGLVVDSLANPLCAMPSCFAAVKKFSGDFSLFVIHQ